MISPQDRSMELHYHDVQDNRMHFKLISELVIDFQKATDIEVGCPKICQGKVDLLEAAQFKKVKEELLKK